MTSFYRRQLGKEGERLAVQFLRQKSLSIRQTNFRCWAGEIDIIAEDAGSIIFVEVKTRSGQDYGFPEEAVTYHKQRKLIQLAGYYLQKEQLENKCCRFDVITIMMKDNKVARIDHIEDAFRA